MDRCTAYVQHLHISLHLFILFEAACLRIDIAVVELFYKICHGSFSLNYNDTFEFTSSSHEPSKRVYLAPPESGTYYIYGSGDNSIPVVYASRFTGFLQSQTDRVVNAVGSILVLRRALRPHDMKLRQHGLRSWPCWSPNAGNHPPVKTARKGTPHEKSSSPVRAAFFVVLIGAVFPCYIAQRYRL